MLYRREGMPEEDELVLCTITNVHHHSVFANLDEYDKSGMIHISEVSPGRIRNLRDFVQEGKKVVCKVLRIDKIKGHIDLSLRRVNEGQKRTKTEQIKREQKAENIIEALSKKLNKDHKKLYDDISTHVFQKYEYMYECFEDIVADKVNLNKLSIDPKLTEELTIIVKEKIKPQEVVIKGELTLMSFAPNGLEIIKEALKKVEKAGKDKINVKYLGGGTYGVDVTAPDYKEAEKILKQSTDKAVEFIEENEGSAKFKRIEA